MQHRMFVPTLYCMHAMSYVVKAKLIFYRNFYRTFYISLFFYFFIPQDNNLSAFILFDYSLGVPNIFYVLSFCVVREYITIMYSFSVRQKVFPLSE